MRIIGQLELQAIDMIGKVSCEVGSAKASTPWNEINRIILQSFGNGYIVLFKL